MEETYKKTGGLRAKTWICATNSIFMIHKIRNRIVGMKDAHLLMKYLKK